MNIIEDKNSCFFFLSEVSGIVNRSTDRKHAYSKNDGGHSQVAREHGGGKKP